ncbi:MAG: hypothetical protein K0S38_356 [Candidatus Paceibacter sp.]|jgi:hypothetical protein|nr:hypothetical protein [Candidatus Paceibacter sp.]
MYEALKAKQDDIETSFQRAEQNRNTSLQALFLEALAINVPVWIIVTSQSELEKAENLFDGLFTHDKQKLVTVRACTDSAPEGTISIKLSDMGMHLP